MSTLSASSTLSRRYAESFLNVADEKKATESVAQDLKTLQDLYAGSEDFRRYVRSPLIERKDKQKAAEAIGQKAGLQDITVNFLKLLAQNRRLQALPSIIDAAFTLMAERAGRVAGTITSAYPVEPSAIADVEKALKQATGQDVALQPLTDKALIGGIVVQVGSRIFDASVRRKLDRLKQKLKNPGSALNAAEQDAA